MIIVISGPSGVGKGTVSKLVSEAMGIRIAVSATSREKRRGEKEGKDYYYISEEEFREKIERGEMLEYAVVYGNYYGTLRSEVERSGDVILEIDTQGAMKVLKAHPEVVSIFLMPPNEDELRARLEGRGRESEELMKARLAAAGAEMEIGKRRYKYLVVNDDSKRAAEEIVEMIERERRESLSLES